MAKDKKVSPERIMQFAWGYAPTLTIEAAVKHGYFDLLDKRAATAQEVAKKTRTSLRGAKAILDVLVSLQLLQRKGERFAVSPESGAFLVSTKPVFYGMFFRHI